MRKFVRLGLPALFLLNLSFVQERHQEKREQNVQSFQLLDWVIDEPTAKAMVDNFNHCKGNCKSSKKQVRNSVVNDYIRSNYTVVSVQPMFGRYTDTDVERYRKARGLAANDGRGNVSGFTTVITKYGVVSKTGFLFPRIETIYVDDCTICPPPDSPPCD